MMARQPTAYTEGSKLMNATIGRKGKSGTKDTIDPSEVVTIIPSSWAKCRISLATMLVLGEYSSSEVGQYSSGKLRVS